MFIFFAIVFVVEYIIRYTISLNWLCVGDVDTDGKLFTLILDFQQTFFNIFIFGTTKTTWCLIVSMATTAT